MPSNLMDRGATWLGGKLKTAAGRTVTIKQGAVTLSDITGWVSEHEYEVIDEGGFLTRVLMHDWTFVTADLGTLTLRSGARILDTATGDVYEVMPVGKLPAVGKHDSSKLLTVAHSKEVPG